MTGLNEATEDDHETPQDWKENSWDIKNNRPAPDDDKDARIMKSRQKGLTKRINKFMISEQAEEEKKLLPAAERTDHSWETPNASKGVNSKPGLVHMKTKAENIPPNIYIALYNPREEEPRKTLFSQSKRLDGSSQETSRKESK